MIYKYINKIVPYMVHRYNGDHAIQKSKDGKRLSIGFGLKEREITEKEAVQILNLPGEVRFSFHGHTLYMYKEHYDI